MTVEFLDEASNHEYYPLEAMGQPAGEAEGEKVALVASPTPSEKKSSRGPRRTRISSRPVLDLVDVSELSVLHIKYLQVTPS